MNVWYSYDFPYRETLTLTGGTSGAQVDSQINIDVPYNEDMNSDFSDLRFTDANGVPVSAYLHSKTDGVTANIWIKFPTTPASGVPATYYMFYGNSNATDIWDIDDTFLLGEDFEGQSSLDLSKWSKTGNVGVYLGYVNFYNTSEIVSVAAYDFAQPVSIIVGMNLISLNYNETFITQLIDRNGVIDTIGTGWESNNENYYYGVSDGRRTHSGDQTTCHGSSKHIQTPLSPNSYKWECSGCNTFDVTETNAGNFPTCNTRYLRLAVTNNVWARVYYVYVIKYVENPATCVISDKISMPDREYSTGWYVYLDGDKYDGIQDCTVLKTIAGSAKTEIILSDVEQMKTLSHFADIEIWNPVNNPPGGLIFDGTGDHIRLQNTVSLDSDDWSISFWCKRSMPHTCHSIVTETAGLGSSQHGLITLDKPDTGYYTLNQIQIKSNTVGAWSEALDTGISTVDRAWHHYVIVFSDVSTTLFVDNALADVGTPNTDAATFDINYVCRALDIAGEGYHFDGSLADMRIIDSAIDVTEIDKLYNGIYTEDCKTFWTLTQSTAADYGIYDRCEISHGTSYTSSTGKGALSVDTSPLDQMIGFKGRIDQIVPDYDSNTMVINGRDYLSEIMGRSCVEDYTSQLRSYIVNDIILKYATSLSRHNIADSPSGTTLSYLFKMSAWDALIKCGLEDAYKFYVDTDKDFHYEPKGFTNSGVTVENGVDDILSFNIIENGTEIVNSIIVYGYDDGIDQIIVQADDVDSQNYYGVIKEKKIVNAELTTETMAQNFADAYLLEKAYIAEIIEIEMLGGEDLVPGQLITLKLSNVDIDGAYLLVDKTINYPRGTTKIRVAKYAKNLEVVLNQLIDKILALEASFMDSSSSIAKLFRVNESVLYTDRVTLEVMAASAEAFKIGVADFSEVGVTKIGDLGSGIWREIYDSGY